MSEDVDQHFREISAYLTIGKDLFKEMKRSKFTCNEDYADILCSRSSAYVEGLATITGNPVWPQEVKDDSCSLIIQFQEIRAEYEQRLNGLDSETTQYRCPEESTGRGRPKYVIPVNQLVELRSLNFSWKEIAKMLGVSEKTILRRRCEYCLPIGEDSYTTISDRELDDTISSILSSSPNSGERMVMGALTARNIKVKRERVRASIFRVDPVNRMLRRHTSIRRRVYSVPTPNALW